MRCNPGVFRRHFRQSRSCQGPRSAHGFALDPSSARTVHKEYPWLQIAAWSRSGFSPLSAWAAPRPGAIIVSQRSASLPAGSRALGRAGGKCGEPHRPSASVLQHGQVDHGHAEAVGQLGERRIVGLWPWWRPAMEVQAHARDRRTRGEALITTLSCFTASRQVRRVVPAPQGDSTTPGAGR